MRQDFTVLIELCKEKNIPFRIIHDSGNIVEIKSNTGAAYLFIMGATPFDSNSVVSLCKDKEFFYNYYKNAVDMPKTKGFLNPNCAQEWKNYLKFSSMEEVIKDSEKIFSYPFIAKMNRGSQGKCVFKVHNRDEFTTALNEIYKEDYVALLQDCIDIKSEYRVIYLNKKLMFAYKKNNEHAVFTGNLSPLHFEGAFAEIVENQNLLNAFDKFVQPMLKQKDIPYCGLDIVLDKDNKMWLIEGNCSPGFGYLLQNPKGESLLKGLYTEMFKTLGVLPQNEYSYLLDFWQKNNQNVRC